MLKNTKRNRTLQKTVFIILSLFIFATHASQQVPVQEGLEVNAVVSTQALNRIAVENDRIVSVKGNNGQFELDKDTELGQIFLKPLNRDAVIPIFITTEKGHTYHLGLTTHDLSAESILLVPMEETLKWQQSSSYESLLKTIIQAMYRQSPLEGFVIERSKIKLPVLRGTRVSHLQSYLSPSLSGHVLEVSNLTMEPLHLIEAELYLPGVRAVAIVDKTLCPKAKTRVYWVK